MHDNRLPTTQQGDVLHITSCTEVAPEGGVLTIGVFLELYTSFVFILGLILGNASRWGAKLGYTEWWDL